MSLRPTVRLAAGRVGSSAITLLVCAMVVFAFRYLVPGGPGEEALVSGQYVSQADAKAFIKATDARFGLNRPVYQQFYEWVDGLLHGNLGYSFQSSEPVRTILGQRLAPSLELIVGALLVALAVGGSLGIYSAIRREHPFGRGILLLSGLQLSVPDFWIATVNAAVFGLTLKIFPAVGFSPLSAGIEANLRTMILPILTLAIIPTAFITRHLHNALAQALSSSYVRTAWAMGVPRRQVYFIWALRNAIAPIITFIPLLVAALIGGTVLVEYVFNIPGIGSQVVTAVANQDYPVTQGIVIAAGIIIAALNLLADIALSLVDPRTAQVASRTSGRGRKLIFRRPSRPLRLEQGSALPSTSEIDPVDAQGEHAGTLSIHSAAVSGQASDLDDSLGGPSTLEEGTVRASGPRGELVRNWSSFSTRWKRLPIHSRVGLGVTVLILLATFLAPVLPLQDPLAENLSLVNSAPSLQHLFGTDYVGRDVFSRAVYGARPSYEGAAFGIVVALGLGVPWGLAAGFGGAALGGFLMRIADGVLSFPGILLAIGIVSVLGPSLFHAMIALGITDAPAIARLLRAQVLPNRRAEYVLIAGSLGASRIRVAFRHVLPNALGPVLVQGFALCGIYLVAGAALGFLGFGVQPPAPSWGTDLAGAYQYFVNNPWGTVVPGLAITIAAWSISAFGDGVREWLALS